MKCEREQREGGGSLSTLPTALSAPYSTRPLPPRFLGVLVPFSEFEQRHVSIRKNFFDTSNFVTLSLNY